MLLNSVSQQYDHTIWWLKTRAPCKQVLSRNKLLEQDLGVIFYRFILIYIYPAQEEFSERYCCKRFHCFIRAKKCLSVRPSVRSSHFWVFDFPQIFFPSRLPQRYFKIRKRMCTSQYLCRKRASKHENWCSGSRAKASFK